MNTNGHECASGVAETRRFRGNALAFASALFAGTVIAFISGCRADAGTAPTTPQAADLVGEWRLAESVGENVFDESVFTLRADGTWSCPEVSDASTWRLCSSSSGELCVILGNNTCQIPFLFVKRSDDGEYVLEIFIPAADSRLDSNFPRKGPPSAARRIYRRENAFVGLRCAYPTLRNYAPSGLLKNSEATVVEE